MGFRRKTEDRMASVHAVLDGYELPSFPHVVSDALGKLGDPDVGLGDVANVLELDPGVSVKILSLVNSAAMGMRNPVDSLHKAVSAKQYFYHAREKEEGERRSFLLLLSSIFCIFPSSSLCSTSIHCRGGDDWRNKCLEELWKRKV